MLSLDRRGEGLAVVIVAFRVLHFILRAKLLYRATGSRMSPEFSKICSETKFRPARLREHFKSASMNSFESFKQNISSINQPFIIINNERKVVTHPGARLQAQ